jgi:hypothetical protein
MEKNLKSVTNQISWIDFEKNIIILSKLLAASYVPDIIISIQRGGLIPAVMFSHLLGIRTLKVINVLRTVNDSVNSTKIDPIITKDSNIKIIENKNILIVDDIVGSGKTIEAVDNYVKKYKPSNIKTLTCYLNITNWNNNNNVPPTHIDFIGKIVDTWTAFPWEK